MPLIFKLDVKTTSKIKNNIRDIINTYQTTTFDRSDIGIMQGGRHLVEASFWPIDEALRYFTNEGVIRVDGTKITIIKPEFFDTNLESFTLPITFSIDERIQADLATMTALYAEIFDIENRLRFMLATKLESKYGNNFVQYLPQDIQNKINHEKTRIKVYVLDARNKELEYTDFAHLIALVKFLDLVSSAPLKQKFIEKLDQIKEARDLVAHNTIIIPDQTENIREACKVARKIIVTV